MSKFTVACVQTNSKPDPVVNIAEVSPMIREAKARGAHFITTPEIVGMFEPDKPAARAKAKVEEEHEVLVAFRGLAAELGVWLHGGSLSVALPDNDRLANRSFLIAPDGSIAARYTKIHMFDVQVGDGQVYQESASYKPGEEGVLAKTPWGTFGLTICYDIRFPYLYRSLAQAGAKVLFAPAAFTKVTGEAHWHVLQRARAIENGCFVISAAQCGTHAGDRKTYGHSIIVAPWGEVLADAGEEPGIITAEIDLAKVDEARGKVPSLTHDRAFTGPHLHDASVRAVGE
jgi:predicted amidohydrolase